MDANIGGKSTEQRATVPTISPSLPFPSVRLNLHFCLYRVYCVKFTDPSIKQKRKFQYSRPTTKFLVSKNHGNWCIPMKTKQHEMENISVAEVPLDVLLRSTMKVSFIGRERTVYYFSRHRPLPRSHSFLLSVFTARADCTCKAFHFILSTTTYSFRFLSAQLTRFQFKLSFLRKIILLSCSGHVTFSSDT